MMTGLEGGGGVLTTGLRITIVRADSPSAIQTRRSSALKAK